MPKDWSQSSLCEVGREGSDRARKLSASLVMRVCAEPTGRSPSLSVAVRRACRRLVREYDAVARLHRLAEQRARAVGERGLTAVGARGRPDLISILSRAGGGRGDGVKEIESGCVMSTRREHVRSYTAPTRTCTRCNRRASRATLAHRRRPSSTATCPPGTARTCLG